MNIKQAADSVGVYADTEEELVQNLRLWSEDIEEIISERESAREEWRELQQLLDGQSLVDLEDSANRKSLEADQLASGIDTAQLETVLLEDDLDGLLSQHSTLVQDTRTAWAERRGEFDEFSKNLMSVAEAEEELDRAETELSRISALNETLNKTQELLQAAQDRVHRSLAPVLRDQLKPWLSKVTGERYQDIRVDVETLEVKVSGDGSRLRDAGLLSHGTTEQIYLLLRMAMSRFLTKNDETCPLILDDVTVHCDPEEGKKPYCLCFTRLVASNKSYCSARNPKRWTGPKRTCWMVPIA